MSDSNEKDKTKRQVTINGKLEIIPKDNSDGWYGACEVGFNDLLEENEKLKEENDKIKDWIRKLFLSNNITSNTLDGFDEEGLITLSQAGGITYNYNT